MTHASSLSLLALFSLPLVACNGGQTPDTGDTGSVTDTSVPDDTSDTSVTPDPNITRTVCPDALPVATEGTCLTTPGTGGGMLIQGTVLLPTEVFEGGSVLVDADGLIQCVGCDCSSEAAYTNATLVQCADGVISPGLINPHDHITFTEGAPSDHGDQRYEHRHDWRGSLSTPGNPHGSGPDGAGVQWGEIRMVMAGTTSMVGSGGATGMVRNLDRNTSLRESAVLKRVNNATFPLGDSNERFKSDCNWNYSDTESEIAADVAFLPHVAEGINSYAAEEFRCESTSFRGGQDFTEANTAHIHSIGLSTVDYYRMARDHAQIIWSPRSNISLYGHTAAVTTFDQLGGVIALGTDWTYSGSITPVRELACADQLNTTQYDHYFSDAQLWAMTTVNAAITVGASDTLGLLAPGYIADIAIYNGSAHSDYRAIIDAGAADVALVLRAGQPLYGEASILSSLGASFDPMDVCGSAMGLMGSGEFGSSYSQIASEVSGAYPAFFCGQPDNEPTCVPSRPGEFTGISTADDLDGDGIANDSDNCPSVFNPIRPIDGGAQPDSDSDGEGDPCDATPLLDDLDGDGLLNSSDNCPVDANPDQSDADTDSKGDVCDFCPDIANEIGVCPPAPASVSTIADVRAGATGEVLINGLIVTGLADRGFMAQTPNTDGVNSGLFFFTQGPSGAIIGHKVDVQGVVDDYYGESQLQVSFFNDLGADTPIVPTPLTVAQATDESYEGVLVTLTDGAVTNSAYDCSVDGSCSDAGLWEIDGANGVLVYDKLYSGTDWTAQVGTLPVTGIMGYRWNRRRIMPRDAGDF